MRTIREIFCFFIFRIYFVAFFTFLSVSVASQSVTTYNPYVMHQNDKDYRITMVVLTDNETIVRVEWKGECNDCWVSLSQHTSIQTTDGYSNYNFPIRFFTDGRSLMELDTKYYIVKGVTYMFEMHFDRIPAGCMQINMSENIYDGWYWNGIRINNPLATTPHIYKSESELKKEITNTNDGICGIYEGTDASGYRLACIKSTGSYNYSLVYLGAKNNNGRWTSGDVKALLRESATPGLFKADWYMADKRKQEDVYVTFDGQTMKMYASNSEVAYLKMYPTSSSESSYPIGTQWSGTGFSIGNSFIVTNYHVVNGANKIEVRGILGDFSTRYNAVLVASDKKQDLAIIQIKDRRFNNIGLIPYRIKTTSAEVGEDVFVLGYPLTQAMGEEIKLTTGVISSRTGFQNDMSCYQISAPVQPGNSGGPMFDHNGNVIGIVSSGILSAENVGYAIKTSYLQQLIASSSVRISMPERNSISNLSLSDKVKKIKNYVYLITCSK